MAEMKFKFTIQPYQTEAVDSVVDVFAGQPFDDHFSYRRDLPTEAQPTLDLELSGEELATGFANAGLKLGAAQLLENIKRTQLRNNIKVSDALSKDKLGACSLDVEMETGTGKTYVYIKTMFELNKRYGWSKFIVVVPSIAIREGVSKSFSTMQEHFMEYYGKKARYFVYDSKNLAALDNFSQSADINVMIINIQAFNARGKDARRIRTELDEFGSRRPIDIIAANHPIVILDEPQKMGGAATQERLKDFKPLFSLNYSATHKQHHDLVYVLDALDAYNQNLVKQIEVKGFDIKNLYGTNGYIYLDSIITSKTKPPRAKLEFEIKYKSGIKRESRILGVDDSLKALSHLDQYDGYHISDVNPASDTVTFTNGVVISKGTVIGDVSEETLRRVQIRETIRSHFEKEAQLFDRGIKTLSLFFIDEVAKYRKYDEDGYEINSDYGDIFEEEYTDILNEYLALDPTPYQQYLRQIEPHDTHTGYFSIDKKGRKVDSKTKRGSDESDDISAYDLILKDKERLLSFDTPVRFIFSHSALREGWDNPNVFQICTLKHGGDSSTQKRQEVGRGLRLCVNQFGERQDYRVLGTQIHSINKLTVVASDGYSDFVKSLQEGIREDLYDRPTQATREFFENKTVRLESGEVTVSEKQARDIYRYLLKNGYIDDDDHVTDKYREAVANGTLIELPESCTEIAAGVHKLVQSVYDDSVLDKMVENGNKTKVENKLNDNFYKKEFKELWEQINHKYAYTVDFASDELIEKAIKHIDDKMFVTQLQYTVTSGLQNENLSADKLKTGSSFTTQSTETKKLDRADGSSVKYDLVGKIADGTKLTRRSVTKILAGIRPSTFRMFAKNPEEFISKAIKLINEQKGTMIVDHIAYNQLDGTYDQSIFTAEKRTDYSKAYKAEKHILDYVFTDGYAKDGKSIERKFVEDMDVASEVCVYAKLPKGFAIPTPVGNYSPDWAIAFHKGKVKHIFFIAETKGSMSTMDLKSTEQAKINCAKKLFDSLSSADLVYDTIDSYENLLGIINK